MAVAAYASLVSLSNVLDNIHYRAEVRRPRLNIKVIETLQESVHFLLDFVEAHSLRKREGIEALWRKMAEVGSEAQGTIDFHVVNELCRGSQEDTRDAGFSTFCQNMHEVIEKIGSIKEEIQVFNEGEDVRARLQIGVSVPAGSSFTTTPGGSSITVGFDKHMNKILDVLTRDKSNLQVFPIVGTGGIGKTTLAKNIFDHPLINYHFDLRIWVTISQLHSIQRILRSLLNETESENTGESIAKLGERLHKELFGRRYLIVMDDVWNTEVWDDLRIFFPNNDDGSWIMMTTRLLNVGDYVGSCNPHCVDFLNDDESWNLLCQKVFAQDNCPHAELKKIGEDIAKSCKGLPLLINVIGGLLAKSNMTKEFWDFVAQNVHSLGNLENDEYCFRSLSLSYDNLPIHLKLCFLYMKVYSEDAKIEVLELIKTWVVEGYIRCVSNKSLEDIAKDYIEDLIDRNLIFVLKRTFGGEIISCGIHDLLRDFCLRKFTEECYVNSPKAQHRTKANEMHVCFLCSKGIANEELINAQKLFHFSPSKLEVELLLCDGCEEVILHAMEPGLLRVMNGGSNDFVQPSALRSLCIESGPPSNFTTPLYLLWNLQTLKIRRFIVVLPSKIWEMPQLRHLEAYYSALPNPEVTHVEGSDSIILKNLQTLHIRTFKCSKDISDRIPNVKEIRAFALDSASDLTQLCKLESFTMYSWETNFCYPESLKELHLIYCTIPWEDMTIIGSLPKLQILSMCNIVKGHEWNPIEGEFCQLKELYLDDCEVVYWGANPNCFPKLELLQLMDMWNFEIPLDIGCMDTLRCIILERCGNRVIKSAQKIWQEHRDMGNENLQIQVEVALRTYHQVDACSLEESETFSQILKANSIKIIL